MPVTIDPQDGVVYKGVNPLLFPVDANDRVSAFLSGLDTADNPVLGRFTTDGRLKVDASVSIDTVDIGDVNMRIKLAGGGEDYLYGAMNPDGITRFLYTQDQRMNYTAGSLHVKADNFDVLLSTRATEATLSSFKTAFDTRDLATQTTLAAVNAKLNSLGQKLMAGSVPVVIASDQSVVQVDPIDRVAREAGRVLASDAVFATESKVTTDVLANMRTADMNVRRYVSKHVVVKNVGATNARVNLLASVDDGANFDIILAGNVVLAPGAVLGVDETRAATHIRVEARSNAAGSPTTIETRAYAMGV